MGDNRPPALACTWATCGPPGGVVQIVMPSATQPPCTLTGRRRFLDVNDAQVWPDG